MVSIKTTMGCAAKNRRKDEMKTQRVKVQAGETLEISICKRQRTVKCYSSVMVGNEHREPEAQTVNTGMNAVVRLVGPVTVCLVKSR